MSLSTASGLNVVQGRPVVGLALSGWGFAEEGNELESVRKMFFLLYRPY